MKALRKHSIKQNDKANDFKKILEELLNDQNESSENPQNLAAESLEEFRVLLPKHGHFWDNGYEDIELRRVYV